MKFMRGSLHELSSSAAVAQLKPARTQTERANMKIKKMYGEVAVASELLHLIFCPFNGNLRALALKNMKLLRKKDNKVSLGRRGERSKSDNDRV